MKKDFLLEIGTEEMPAGWLEGTASQLKDKICGLLSTEEIPYGKHRIFYTPRRIAVLIKDVVAKQKDKSIEITGPPKEIALTEDAGQGTRIYQGYNWSESALGFAKAHGIAIRELKLKQKGKKEVLCCEKFIKGKRTIDILKSSLPTLISGIDFPKSMKWEISGFRFGRPVRWIVALLGETVVPFEVAGIKSGRMSQGLRFTSQITIKSPASYEEDLMANGIVADPTKRKKFIEEEILKLLKGKGIYLQVAQPGGFYFTDLLTEVVNLVECPKAILGKFDEKYLELPHEVIVAAMEAHQRYFAINNLDGTLSHYFVVIANAKDGDIAKIREGHERVLKARLEDAEFYYLEDLKVPLENRVNELKEVIYHEELGTIYDKTGRRINLSKYIAQNYIPKDFSVDLNVLEKAARFSLTDLVTNMIKDGKEFTALSGVYASILVREQGLGAEVAETIKESVLSIPAIGVHPEAVILGISDFIDTIVSVFILDKIPTGSSDPLGIRIAGNLLIRFIVDNRINIPLRELVSEALKLYDYNIDIEYRIFEFLIQRFRRYLERKDVRYDIIGAVLETQNDDLVDLHARVDALDELKDKKDFVTLVRLAKRVRNILSQKSKVKSQKSKIEVQLLKEIEEKGLYNALISGEHEFENYIDKKDYSSALSWLLNLADLINNFFDKVLVMAPEVELRENRVALLNYLYSFFQKLADFSKITE